MEQESKPSVAVPGARNESVVIEKKADASPAPKKEGSMWDKFLAKIKEDKASLAIALQGCQHSEADNEINISVSNGFYFDRLIDRANLEFLEKTSKDLVIRRSI